MNRWSHRMWSVTAGLALAGSLLLGGTAPLAQSPGGERQPGGPAARPLPTLAAAVPVAARLPTLPSLTVFAAASLNKPFTRHGPGVGGPARRLDADLLASMPRARCVPRSSRARQPMCSPRRTPRIPRRSSTSASRPRPSRCSPPTTWSSSCPRPTQRASRTSADLAKPGVRIVAAGPDVPITKYAEQLITNLAAQPGRTRGICRCGPRQHRVPGGQRGRRAGQDRAGRG